MNRFKMLVLDIDGTILNSAGALSARTWSAVVRARHAGLLVTLATGRNWAQSQPVAAELGITGPIVVSNGALVATPGTGEVLLHRPLESQVAVHAVRSLQRLGFCVFASRGELGGASLLFEQPPLNPAAARLLQQDPASCMQVYDLAGASAAGNALKVFTVDSAEAITSAAPRLRRHLPRAADLLVMPEGNGYALLEITTPGVTKATGVQSLATRYGLTMNDVIAIGDNLNDLELLRAAGLAVAMGNASAEVQKIADIVTDTHDRDGVAAFLEEYVFKVA